MNYCGLFKRRESKVDWTMALERWCGFISYFQGSLSQTIGGKSMNAFTEVAILWTAWVARHALLDRRELEEKLVFLSLWLALDSSAMTSAQRPVKSPSNQRFARSLTILKVSHQEKCLPEGLIKMHLASIMNLHKEFMSEGDDKMEFNSVVTRPDHVSWVPLGIAELPSHLYDMTRRGTSRKGNHIHHSWQE